MDMLIPTTGVLFMCAGCLIAGVQLTRLIQHLKTSTQKNDLPPSTDLIRQLLLTYTLQIASLYTGLLYFHHLSDLSSYTVLLLGVMLFAILITYYYFCCSDDPQEHFLSYICCQLIILSSFFLFPFRWMTLIAALMILTIMDLLILLIQLKWPI